MKKKSREWAKSRKGSGRKSNKTRKKRGDIEMWDQADSPEIPDRGETSEIPSLPSGGQQTKTSDYTPKHQKKKKHKVKTNTQPKVTSTGDKKKFVIDFVPKDKNNKVKATMTNTLKKNRRRSGRNAQRQTKRSNNPPLPPPK